MAERLKPGFYPEGGNVNCGLVYVMAWQAPEYSTKDPDVKRRYKLLPQRSILVRRSVSCVCIGPPKLMYDDDTYLSQWSRKNLSMRMRNLINKAIRESRRVCGGG